MKKMKFNLLTQAALLLVALSILTMPSCKKDDDDPDPENPIASFQFAISETNFLEVIFTNFSQHATSYSWNFGDGNTSTEESPTHVYAEAGNYNVVLTAANSAGTSANYSQSIEITDPDQAIVLLAGETSKTWKLFREGISMSFGSSIDDQTWWAGLENNGARPCLYYHEFTFHRDGKYAFDDKGSFWGEYGVWGAVEGYDDSPLYGTCFEAIPENMVNAAGEDVSAWLSGEHSFTYNPSAGTVTLEGLGAWIGIPKLGTNGESRVPLPTVTFKVSIIQETGYDLLKVGFDYGDGGYWPITYVSYSDPSLEPPVEEEEQPWGEDLPNITPDEIFVTFVARDFENMATIDTVASGSSVVFGVDDPADAGAPKVGRFIRTGGVQWQELQFRTTPELYDIQFDNFTVAKIDIYIPDNTEFTEGGLQRFFVFGFADMSQTQEWWTSPTQFFTEGDDVVLGEWATYTFDLTEVKEREDLDMIFLGIGGGGHEVEGIFYVRNLVFD